MALQSGEADMSPKAKVSYDQDKFQVEFNVQDYTPEVSPHFLDVSKTVLYKHSTSAFCCILKIVLGQRTHKQYSIPVGVHLINVFFANCRCFVFLAQSGKRCITRPQI